MRQEAKDMTFCEIKKQNLYRKIHIVSKTSRYCIPKKQIHRSGEKVKGFGVALLCYDGIVFNQLC